MIDNLNDLAKIVEWMDNDLDGAVAEKYKGQPLAQDWARVAKLSEEVGEAIDALIGITGQNPRKGRIWVAGRFVRRASRLCTYCDLRFATFHKRQHDYFR